MKTIRLRPADVLSDVNAGNLEGCFLYGPHFDRTIRESTTVLKPDGSPLLIYVRDAIPTQTCASVRNRFKSVRLGWTDARGLAAGGSAFRKVRRDGKRSGVVRWRPIRSDVLGFLDRVPRNPYCRMTHFTRTNLPAYAAMRPLVAAADQAFRQWAPDRWEAQKAFVNRVSRDFVIPDTVFTSVTVNRSVRTAAHTDRHDYRPGMGVMAVIEDGRFYGGELIFSKYRTAVDMRTGGVCLADVHELHANAPMVGERFVRWSFILYARDGMGRCAASVEAERVRAAAMVTP